jgi:hypothetical protein
MLIGTAFTWFDFPDYFIGSSLGWLWLRLNSSAKKAKKRIASKTVNPFEELKIKNSK